MIRVIASDLDGTLLGNDHKVAKETLQAIYKAQDAGIRFMVESGRSFFGAVEALKGTDFTCDYIVGSGAQIRDANGQVIEKNLIPAPLCKKVYEQIRKFPVSIIFCTDKYEYRIGTPEEIEESMRLQCVLFYENVKLKEVPGTDLYRRIKANTKVLERYEVLEEEKIEVDKIFVFSKDVEMLSKMREKLEKDSEIAVASSFITNLEITSVKAQKGPVIKSYIESLGYKMEEVMVLGDSLNDHSMISMDFGATVAMENALPEIKKAAKYVTKSNEEFGVAWAIEKVLDGTLDAMMQQESPDRPVFLK